MQNRVLIAYVCAIAIAAVAAILALPPDGVLSRPGTALLLGLLTAAAGAWPVRISSMRTQLVATHPFVLCAMAAVGPLAASLSALGGVVGTTLGGGRPKLSLRTAFNLSAVTLTTVVSYWVFLALGGRSGAALTELLPALAGATTAYFVVNTGLVAIAIMLERHRSFLSVWKNSFLWTAISYFAGLPLAAALLLLLESFGPWGLALGIPPCLLLVAFYRTHKERLEEKMRRIHEVEALNEELQRTVRDLEQALAEVREGSRRLEHQVREREHAEEALRRSEDQLRQSQKMEAVGRLAGGVAHDFNNLLTAISGYSDLMLRRADRRDPLWGYADEIRRAGERAASLTRQLLAFSRRQVLEPKILDLDAVVENIEKMLERLIGEDIALVAVHGSDLGRVKADPGQMEQVIMNLAVNARDAMPDGGTVRIETNNVELNGGEFADEFEAAAGPYVRLALSDTGCGMSEQTRMRIFEPFFTTKEEGKGTGLGLATVYGIVKQSGGWIHVESAPGAGTTFEIYLPRVEGEVEEVAAPSAEIEASRGHETILLVEDEEQVRDLAREILQMNGYTVCEAQRVGDALLICERHAGAIDLMLTDVVMPQMNGPELYERLAPSRPEMRVLYMSGYTERAAVSDGFLQEGAAYIQKPFTLDGLARKVREVLDGSRIA